MTWGMRFLVASALVHAAVFALLLAVRPREAPRRRTPIVVDIQRPPAPPPEPTAAPSVERPSPGHRPARQPAPEREPERQPEPDPRLAEPSGPIDPSAPPPSTDPTPAPGHRPDLFSSHAITTAIGT